ncbi:MAG: NAD-dependent epimerase/dehydratase family protein [Gemmatimonadota bacterium]
MSPTRREFIWTTGMIGAGLAVGGLGACSQGDSPAPSTSKRILIFGGTGLIGPNMVEYAVGRGHQVSIFTRGRAEDTLPESVERLVGDRNDDHAALEGRSWDVVMDNNTSRDYRWVQRSTELLRDATDHYIFVSSISAYDIPPFQWSEAQTVMREPLVSEDYPLADPPEEWTMGEDLPYGPMKAFCENLVHEVFPGRSTVVRPGLIVGPGDPTNRWTYWPVRFDQGGEILAPGNPEHAMQVIDQRDLTEWVVRLAENGTMGDFNATGPGERLSMGSMLEQISAVTEVEHEMIWVPETFLEEQGVSAWTDLPAWMPGNPLMFVDVSQAVAAGLTYRSIGLTAADTVAWDRTRSQEEREEGNFGISREREREVLDAWAAAQG